MKIAFILIVLLIANFVFGQAGGLDTTFNEYYYDNFGDGSGIQESNDISNNGGSTEITKAAELNDGKLILLGTFQSYNGVICNNFIRVFPNGKIDLSFQPAITDIQTFAIQADEKIIVFSTANGLKRLNTDGSIDNSFTTPVIGGSNDITTICVLSTGDIVIGGRFNAVSGTTRKGLAKLNSVGVLDAIFNVPQTAGSYDYCQIQELTGNKLLILGGPSLGYVGTPKGLIRVDSDGTLDPSFNNGVGYQNSSQQSSCFTIDDQQRIIISGNFNNISGVTRNYIARLTEDGALDLSFDAGTNIQYGVYSNIITPDGKLFVSGSFSTASSSIFNGIVSLNPDGTLNSQFQPGPGAECITGGDDCFMAVQRINLLQSGKLLIVGGFESFDGTLRNDIATINQDGTLITTDFSMGTGTDDKITALTIYPDNRILISGTFNHYNEVKRKGIAIIQADGALDLSFDPLVGFNDTIDASTPQADGKILVAGSFTNYNGTPVNSLARLLPDGTLDASFNPGAGANNSILKILVQPDGKILISGKFTSFNGTSVNRIVRLQPNGTIDPSFTLSPAIEASNSFSFYEIQDLFVQPDGKILIAGYFNVSSFRNYARLNADGSLDNSFNLLSIVPFSDYHHWKIAAGNDGTIVLAGNFMQVNGFNTDGLMSLFSNGNLNHVFEIENNGFNYTTHSFVMQPDGRIIVGGVYTTDAATYPDVYQNQVLKRMNTDGTVDVDFLTDPNQIMDNLPNNIAYNLAFQNDGKLIASGKFRAFDDFPANNIARFNNDIDPINPYILNFVDLQDLSCTTQGSATAQASFGTPPYSYAWQTSPIVTSETLTINEAGIYTCIVTDNTGTSLTRSLFVSGPESITAYELNANLQATAFRPGFAATTWIDAFNGGCIPATGQLKFVVDPILNITGFSAAPSGTVGDTLIWDFVNLAYSTPHILPQVYFNTDSQAAIGDSVELTILMTPSVDDAEPINNIKHYKFPIVNGYDPNTKSVYPIGKCDVGYIKTEEFLTYTIHFQNTGNSEAINISVIDSISPSLDLSTLNIIGKSHLIWTEVLPGNTLKFHFDGIYLADSLSNEPESHGYVIFKIKPFQNSPHNTEINNKAEIYFDYNPAVVTNSVQNQVFAIGDLDTYNCTAVTTEIMETPITVFPNPTNGIFTIHGPLNGSTIVLTDLHGKKILEQAVFSDDVVYIDSLQNGVYFVTISGTKTVKIIKE